MAIFFSLNGIKGLSHCKFLKNRLDKLSVEITIIYLELEKSLRRKIFFYRNFNIFIGIGVPECSAPTTNLIGSCGFATTDISFYDFCDKLVNTMTIETKTEMPASRKQ